MRLHTTIGLVFLGLVTACSKEPETPVGAHGDGAAGSPPVAPSAAAAQAGVPTAADLLGLFEVATRVEVTGASPQQQSWTKQLTKEDISNLKAGIGAAKFSAAAPRCIPTVRVRLYKEQTRLAELGGYCDGAGHAGPMRFEFNDKVGSFVPEDAAQVNLALATIARK